MDDGRFVICSHTRYQVTTSEGRPNDGRIAVITDHGKPVGRIVPAGQTLDDKMRAMVAAGLAERNGKKLKPMKPVARVKKGYSVADLLIEGRR